MSKPEVMLWQQLRGDPMGVRFRRQHPVGPFVLDFYCATANLAIEVDGIVHDMGDQPDFDAKRSEWLADNGIEVVRIPAIDVLRDPPEVANAIVRFALSRRRWPLHHRRCAPAVPLPEASLQGGWQGGVPLRGG